jgi:hypothetical protein
VDLYLEGARPSLDIRPSVLRPGDCVQIAFRAARIAGTMNVPHYDVSVLDARRTRVATLLSEPVRPTGGVVCLVWDGRDDRGFLLPPGPYQLRVEGVDHPLLHERTLLIEG